MVATDPPGSATVNRPRAATARRPESSTRAASRSARNSVLSTSVSTVIVPTPPTTVLQPRETSDAHPRPRHALRQHHPHAVHGRGAAGQLRPSGHADGDGARRLCAVAAASPLRSRRSHLAQPRPLRAVDGPRLDAALLDAAPDRGQGREPEVRDARRAGGDARRHQAVPPARQQVPRPSRIPVDVRHRDDDRPARAGRGHQRRHGHGRQVDGRAVQPARLRDVRLRRLRAGRRRLHDGRRLRRSGVAGRPPQARQPLLDLRQQPHHDRGRHQARLQRGRGHALHRLRLERHARRATPTTSRCSTARSRRPRARRTARR